MRNTVPTPTEHRVYREEEIGAGLSWAKLYGSPEDGQLAQTEELTDPVSTSQQQEASVEMSWVKKSKGWKDISGNGNSSCKAWITAVPGGPVKKALWQRSEVCVGGNSRQDQNSNNKHCSVLTLWKGVECLLVLFCCCFDSASTSPLDKQPFFLENYLSPLSPFPCWRCRYEKKLEQWDFLQCNVKFQELWCKYWEEIS